MIERQLTGWLKMAVDRPQIVHIYGMRQTGKTTMMDSFRQSIPGHLYYPFQDYVVFNRYQADIERWIQEVEESLSRVKADDKLHVFVDEVQKIPDMFHALQGLYDAHKGRLKFWIWGSSARPLKKKKAETLAGRFISRTLYPLSQSEILGHASVVPHILDYPQNMTSVNHMGRDDYSGFLDKCFRHSMLPEAFLDSGPDEIDDLLEAYQASYLENEIRRENLVSDIGIFNRFLRIAASENSSVINYASIAKDLGISSPTVRAYHDILADTFVTSHLSPYSSRLRVQVCKSPKVYFSDTGLARFVSGERGVPTRDGRTYGALFECFVFNEILKQKQYHHLPWELFFLRTKTGTEVDLVVSSGGKKCAIEVKCKSRISAEDCRGINYLMAEDSSISFGIVISLQGAPLTLGDRIYNLPAWNL